MNSDFVSWDDLDLDYFLGEENWTDDEESDVFGPEIEVEESESDDDIADEEITEQTAAPKSTVTTPKKTSQTTGKENKKPSRLYRCPECQKDYKSSSGFRGHVSKKHNRPDLKG